MLSGGLGLGAFGAGAAAALQEAGGERLRHVAGASAGALTAAILAGNPPEQRVARLRAFWDMMASSGLPEAPAGHGPLRSAYNQLAAWQTLLWGRPGAFRSRLLPAPLAGAVPAMFDLAPLIETLPRFIDFDRLNDGALRVSLVATDIESGDRVVFDTAQGTPIGGRHVAACGAMLPLLSPIELEGRLLGDGGLASNAPVDLAMDAPRAETLACFVLEQFPHAGSRPDSIGAALSRAIDLGYGNQTRMLVERIAREAKLRAAFAGAIAALPPDAREGLAAAPADATLLMLDYYADASEAGALKPLDFSRATLEERWRGGSAAMAEALRCPREDEAGEMLAPGLRLLRIAGGTVGAA